MANKIDPKEVVPVEEALQMEMLINQALIDILVSRDHHSRRAAGPDPGAKKASPLR